MYNYHPVHGTKYHAPSSSSHMYNYHPVHATKYHDTDDPEHL